MERWDSRQRSDPPIQHRSLRSRGASWLNPPMICRQQDAMDTAYAFSHTSIDGDPVDLSKYQGKVSLMVNVASKCGLTPQYTGLESLQKKYSHRGFSVLGFPCNQFGAQEPGTEAEIKTFCSSTYGVSFPMFAKLDVNGENRHSLYAWLTAQDTQPEGPGDISWNFGKFLIGQDGRVLARFSPSEEPEGAAITEAIERALS